MHEKVRSFLEDSCDDDIRRNDETLIRLGLWEKEYASEGDDIIRYPERDENGRPWRKKAVCVTDEEWEHIRKAAHRRKNNQWEELLKVFAGLCCAAAVLQLFVFAGSLDSILQWLVLAALCMGVSRGLMMLRQMQR